MAGIFGKIFVGIYVEIKRSDGTLLASHTQTYTHIHTHTALHPVGPDERS